MPASISYTRWIYALLAKRTSCAPLPAKLTNTFARPSYSVPLLQVSPYLPVLTKLVTLGAHYNMTISACPVLGQDVDSWVELVKATSTARAGGLPGVSFLSLQTYGGGYGQSVQDYVNSLQGIVPTPASFVYAGGEVGGDFGPSDAAGMISEVKRAVGAANNGGMVWDYRTIVLGYSSSSNVTAWGSAINAVLDGNTQAAGVGSVSLLNQAAVAQRRQERAGRNRRYCQA